MKIAWPRSSAVRLCLCHLIYCNLIIESIPPFPLELHQCLPSFSRSLVLLHLLQLSNMRKHRAMQTFPKTPPQRPASTPTPRLATPSMPTTPAAHSPTSPTVEDSVPPHLRKWAASPATTHLTSNRQSTDSAPRSMPSHSRMQTDLYSSFAILPNRLNTSAACPPSSIPPRQCQPSLPSKKNSPQQRLPAPSRTRRHRSLQHENPSSLLQRLRSPRHHTSHQYLPHVNTPSTANLHGLPPNTAPASMTPIIPDSSGLPSTQPSKHLSRSNTEYHRQTMPRSDNLFSFPRRVISLSTPSRSRGSNQASVTPRNHDALESAQTDQSAAENCEREQNMQVPSVLGQHAHQHQLRDISASRRYESSYGSEGNQDFAVDPAVGQIQHADPDADECVNTRNIGGNIASRGARKAVRVLSGRRGTSSRQLDAKTQEGESTADYAILSDNGIFDAESGDVLQMRLRILENELETSRVRMARQRRRIQQLEDESFLSRQALPAVETIIQNALSHFDAKEAVLKHTIMKIHQEMAVVVAEKNEALRLLATFVGRSSGRSPPASLSSMSEAGLDIGGTLGKESRRSGSSSSGTARRAITEHAFEPPAMARPHTRSRAHERGFNDGRLTRVSTQ